MRIVIDSNVWVSALVFGGMPRFLFECVVREGWTIILSEEILTEVRRVINKKFPDFIADFDSFILVLAPRITLVKLGSIHLELSRDPDDDRIIETAVIGSSHYVVTGDNDLLSLRSYEAIRFVSPSEFMASNQ
ncbi:putative toxin-antitoxin system toxin component, PIN family [soil metagenome]